MRWAYLAIVAVLGILPGCSGMPGDSPVQPPIENPIGAVDADAQRSEGPNRLFWGFWRIDIGSDHLTCDVVPIREAEMHLNVVTLLEVSPCKNCLTIGSVIAPSPNEIRLDVSLTHPIPGNLKLTGFDVRGIFISEATCNFPEAGRDVAWGEEIPRLVNAAGYTQLFNPTEFDPSLPVPPILKYTPGRFSPGGNPTATLNPYVAYCMDRPRCVFLPGEVNTQRLILSVPDGPLSFGYAVDACWANPMGPVTDPITDFPDDANCLEAYRIDLQVGAGLGTDPGSRTAIEMAVYDHQPGYTIRNVSVEAPDLFKGTVSPIHTGEIGDEGRVYRGEISNEFGTPEGEYPILARVQDRYEDKNLGEIDAWQIGTVKVGPKNGWALTWGAGDRDACWDIALDESGNIYAVGQFGGTVDFDPGPGEDIHTAEGDKGAFLCKFSAEAELIWARTWGRACANAVSLDESGNPSVAGVFWGPVDFDPGPGTEEREALGFQPDVFVSRFDSEGGFQWVGTWGRDYLVDGANDVASGGMGALYITGYFSGMVDFDPGSGTEQRQSNGEEDAYLVRLDNYGQLEWVNTWGGEGGVSGGLDDEGWGVAVDESGGVYAIGNFHTTTDFDPGPGVEERTPLGDEDAFLVKFGSQGGFRWVRTWGGLLYASASSVDVGPDEGVLVAGAYKATVDFDPGPEIVERSTNGSADCYVSLFDTGGRFEQVWTWQCSSDSAPTEIKADESGSVFLTGLFMHSIDLNPGTGVDERISNGFVDAFVVKVDPLGDYAWGRSWGGESPVSQYVDDEATSLGIGSGGDVYVAGHFEGAVDFEPGAGEEKHISNGLWDACLLNLDPEGNW